MNYYICHWRDNRELSFLGAMGLKMEEDGAYYGHLDYNELLFLLEKYDVMIRKIANEYYLFLDKQGWQFRQR